MARTQRPACICTVGGDRLCGVVGAVWLHREDGAAEGVGLSAEVVSTKKSCEQVGGLRRNLLVTHLTPIYAGERALNEAVVT